MTVSLSSVYNRAIITDSFIRSSMISNNNRYWQPIVSEMANSEDDGGNVKREVWVDDSPGLPRWWMDCCPMIGGGFVYRY